MLTQLSRLVGRGLLGVAVATLTWASAPAQAALVSSGLDCSATSTSAFIDCSGSWKGDNRTQFADVLGQIATDWHLTGLVSQSVPSHESSTGTLNFAPQTGKFVLALQSGNDFSLYEYQGSVASAISSLAYDTLGVGTRHEFGEGLQHADIYVPVPEPETYTLMLAGLGALGFIMGRRKQ